MAKRPWEKSLVEASKYDWLTAVNHNRRHSARPRDLRVAIALMQLADKETGLAWPTQETLAEYSGLADPRQVRAALTSLAGTGAIEIVRLSELSETDQETVAAKRNRRGNAYRLGMFWALETLEACRSPVHARSEPERLASARSLNRTTTIRSKRTTTVRCTADYDSPAYTNIHTKDTGQGLEGRRGLTSSREGVIAYALANCDDPNRPFPAPDTEQQLEEMLSSLVNGVNFTPAMIGYFRKRLQDGQLTPAEIEEGKRVLS